MKYLFSAFSFSFSLALAFVLAVPLQSQNNISVNNYDVFDVNFSWHSAEGINQQRRVLFGVLLPKGWRVSDRNKCTVASTSTSVNAQFAYCQWYSDYLNKNITTPEGYYWWGGRSFDKILFNRRIEYDFNFSLKIFTDKKTGNFALKYAVGSDLSNNINNYFVSEDFNVTVNFANEFPAQKKYNWQQLSGSYATDYFRDKDFDGFFERYYGWNGGDVGMSTLLPDGRNIWTWGDYDAGVVNSLRQRLNELWQFPRNGLTLQDGLDFSAFRLLTDKKLGQIKAAIVYKDDNGNEIDGGQHWYWPMGGHIFYRNGVPELQILLEHTRNAGGGQWGMEGVSTDVAVFSLPDLTLQHVAKNRYVGKVGFGNVAFKDDDGAVYVYGERNFGICVAATFVARNIDGDLAGEWEFYNNATLTWTTDHAWAENDAEGWWNAGAQLLNNSIFVFKDGGKYFALEQEPCFSPNSFIHDAASPVGPFANRRKVGVLPSDITASPYICYIPALHQQFSKDGELLYSVSKNVNGDFDRFGANSADKYLPYFFRVKKWRDKLNIVENDLTKIDATAYTPRHLLFDDNASTVYNIATENGKHSVDVPLENSVLLRQYTITSAPDSPEKDPLHWQLLGSSDGETWAVLDERYYATFEERSQTNSYTPKYAKTCRYFRLNVLKTNGNSSLQIAEWQLFGQEVDFEYSPAGVNEQLQITNYELQIFPNPVKEELHLHFPSFENLESVKTVEIYDIFGKKILTSHLSPLASVNVSHLSKGIYLLKIGEARGKFVKI